MANSNPNTKSVDIDNISVRHGNLLMFEPYNIRILDIINLQYTFEKDDNQCVILTNILYHNVPITIASVHLASGAKRIDIRRTQIEYVFNQVRIHGYPNAILLGDFNENELSDILKERIEYKFKDLLSFAYNRIKISGLPPFSKSQVNNPSKSGKALDDKLAREVLDYIIFSVVFIQMFVRSIYTLTYDSEDNFEGDPVKW